MNPRPTSPSIPCVLAMDQGGHASRAVLFSLSGEKITSADCPVDTLLSPDGRVEHDPEEIVQSLLHCISEAVGKAPTALYITAAGLATQRSTIVCWDKATGEALSPVISWRDRRAADLMETLRPHEKTVREKTGLVLSPHYGASKLRWCWDNLPSVRKAHEKKILAWGPLASFLIHRLLAEHPLLVDPANASRTLLWNLQTGNWDPDLLKLFGLPEDSLPRCVPSRFHYGHLKCGGEDVPLTIVTGDQSAALFAFGGPDFNRVHVNIGTGAFAQRAVSRLPDSSSPLLRGVAYLDKDSRVHVLEGTVNGAGSALSHAARELGIDETQCLEKIPRWLKEEMDPPLFLNGVSGLGSPFWIPEFPSRFVGEGSREARMAGVVESIVFLIQANLEAMADLAGTPGGIIATGGLSSLEGLCRRLADLSGCVVLRSGEPEATALGLARLLQKDPEKWEKEIPFGHVNPSPNEPLLHRYRKWRRAMAEAMNKR